MGSLTARDHFSEHAFCVEESWKHLFMSSQELLNDSISGL